MKRQRGRGRKPGGGGGGGGGHVNHGNRSLESNGPEVKIRGTAAQIYEKYMQYARDSQSGGDRVKYENYLQHAEHYFRIMAATMPREQRVPQQLTGGDGFINAGETTPTGDEAQPSNDALKVVDEGDDEDSDGDEIEAGADGEGDDADGDAPEGQPQQQANNQGGDQRDGRRRRRRRHRDGDRGPNPGGGGGGNNGSDPEARSALDALAQKQGALG